MHLSPTIWSRPTRAGIAAVALGLGVGMSHGAAGAAPDITVKYFQLEQTCCGAMNLTISADARYVAYRSSYAASTAVDIFILDLQTGVRTQANLTVAGGIPTGAQCDAPAMSADGRYVVFGCAAPAMGTLPVPVGNDAYYVYDRINNKTEMLPLSNSNRVSRANAAAISANGRYIAYRSFDAANNYSLFVRDMVNKTTQSTTAKSVFVHNRPANINVSDDGRFVSYNGRVISSNPIPEVSVYDVTTGVTELVNVSTAGVPGKGGGNFPNMSADGNVVSFMSGDIALTSPPAPANGGVFVRDRRAGTTELVSTVIAGSSANYNSMSANGRYIAFTGNPVPTVKNLYVYDRLTKAARIIPGAITNQRTASYSAFTPDGRYMVFESQLPTGGIKSIGFADLGAPAGLNISSEKLSLTEGGAAGTYTLVLKQIPSANVTVSIKPDQQLTVARSQLIFTPDNWNIPQVVSVQAVQDGVQEGAHAGAITHTVTSTDIDYTVIPATSVEVAIADAIPPTIVLPASVWNRSDLPVSGTAAPGATVLLTAVNRTTGWMSSVSTVADAQGRWSYTMTGFTDGSVDLDAQADGIRSAVQTVTVKLAVIPPQPTFTDVTGYIRTTAYGLIYNRSTGKYAGDFVLTNTGSIKLSGPLHLQFDHLTAGVTLSNATGAHEGAPFITVPGGLEPDQSVTIPLLFDNPGRGGIGYDAKIYSGTF